MTKPKAGEVQAPDAWTWTLAVLLLLLWAAVLAVLLTPEVSSGHGFEHSTFPTMDQGGDGARRHQPVLIRGWLLGCVVIATFVSLLACGALGGRSATNWRLTAFLVGGLCYEAAFGFMCSSYRDSISKAPAAFIGPFPEPLAWLLFGIWFVPTFFVVLYVLFFYDWIWPPDNARRFAELIARSSSDSDSHEPHQAVP